MAIPELTRCSAEARIRAVCERKVPPHAPDQFRLEHTVRGDAITIIERRPPWREDFGPEGSSMRITQLRFDATSSTWSLWWSDRNEHWHRYDDLGPTADLDVLLAETDDDSTSIFWG